MSSDEPVIVDLSLKEYFVDLMSEVNKENSLKISDYSYVYLADLLESYALAKESKDNDDQSSKLMISEQYLIALQESEEGVRSYRLRSVGERALYQIGFFSEALKRKLVGLNLYFQIGSSAYSGLYQKTQNPVFKDIGLNFSSYVDLFMGVSQKVNIQSQSDILNLFEHMNERDSKKAEADLIKLGVLPVKTKKASNQ